jgi:threonine dehydrogenase-like Zn-dependent dehydrogenase
VRAVVCSDAKLEVRDQPPPIPGRGQLLIQVLRCGICGSDLHARHSCDELADVAAEVGYDAMMRRDQEVVLGHEFCGEIVAHGPACRKYQRTGTRVVAFPLLRQGNAVHTTGFAVAAPGGYAEQMLVEESMALPVPNGLSTEIAALTEPMAVGLHAVRRSQIGKGTPAIVIGCGPVGLAVIGMLKATGVRTVIASDFSPGRRALAKAVGADVVVDPGFDSPFAPARLKGHFFDAQSIFELAVGSMEKLRRIPALPWWQVYRAAEAIGATNLKHPVVFECVGVPGILEQIISTAPLYSRVVVVGVCMQPDRIRPAMAINKEIDLRFVLGYTPIEFRDSLHLLADGKVNAAPVVTGVVGLGGVDNAFDALADPETHAKILIDPASPATHPVPPSR